MSFEKKVEEYLRMKKARKRGEFNDEIDLDEALYQDYYQDFDVEGDVDDIDNNSFYDYYDFIANTDPGALKGHQMVMNSRNNQRIYLQFIRAYTIDHFNTVHCNLIHIVISINIIIIIINYTENSPSPLHPSPQAKLLLGVQEGAQKTQ